MYIFTDIVQDISMRKSIVARLEIVCLGKDSRKLFASGKVFQDLTILKVVSCHKVTFGSDNVRSRRITRTKELVQILQGVLIKDNVRVHADDIIVLGFKDTHVSRRRNTKGILELATLNQSKIKLVAVIHVDLLNIIRRVVVDDNALKLEVRNDLLLGETRKSLANNFVLIEGGKDTRKVDSIGIECLLVGNGEWNLARHGGAPFRPRVDTRTFEFLIIRGREDDMSPVGSNGTFLAARLIINQDVSLNKSLVGCQDETRKPIGAKVFGNPLGLNLGTLSVIVLVGRRHKLDLIAIRKHFLNGLNPTVLHDGIQFNENDSFNHGASVFFLAFDPRSTRFRCFHLILLLFFTLVVAVVDSHVDMFLIK
mmetsp:Transcript_27619/g.49995  ORF Transcript_27619/g.49995 Transcript_27619/m.49995 type:complete len:367 (-) Transcript_27619:38-1138(-)